MRERPTPNRMPLSLCLLPPTSRQRQSRRRPPVIVDTQPQHPPERRLCASPQAGVGQGRRCPGWPAPLQIALHIINVHTPLTSLGPALRWGCPRGLSHPLISYRAGWEHEVQGAAWHPQNPECRDHGEGIGVLAVHLPRIATQLVGDSSKPVSPIAFSLPVSKDQPQRCAPLLGSQGAPTALPLLPWC